MEGSELKSYCPQNIKLAVAVYFQDWGQQADLPDSRLAKQLQVIQKSGIKHINNTFRNTVYTSTIYHRAIVRNWISKSLTNPNHPGFCVCIYDTNISAHL